MNVSYSAKAELGNNLYWNSNGLFQDLYIKLDAMIPPMDVVKGKANKNLEYLRRVSNVAYDLYNNGLYNRATSVKGLFGVTTSRYKEYRYTGRGADYVATGYDGRLNVIVEFVLNCCIALAALEQGLVTMEQFVVMRSQVIELFSKHVTHYDNNKVVQCMMSV